MTATHKFKVGDIVWVGAPAPLDRKATWKIARLDQAAEGLEYATLISGRSERSSTAPTTRLTPFRVMENAA